MPRSTTLRESSACTPHCSSIHTALQSKLLRLEAELDQLGKRYDQLLQAKEAAALRHRSDYLKWKRFKEWLLVENPKDLHERGHLPPLEKTRMRLKAIRKNQEKFLGDGPQTSDVLSEDSRSLSAHFFKNIKYLKTKVATAPGNVGKENYRPKSWHGKSESLDEEIRGLPSSVLKMIANILCRNPFSYLSRTTSSNYALSRFIIRYRRRKPM